MNVQMDSKKPEKKDYKRMSVDELRCFDGCEHYSKQEAEEIIDTLEQMTFVFFKLYQKNKKPINHE